MGSGECEVRSGVIIGAMAVIAMAAIGCEEQDAASENGCANSAECGSGLYCDIYDATQDGDVASNICEAQREAGSVCGDDIQCAAGMVCADNHCADEDSARNACITDAECGSGQYCDIYDTSYDGDWASNVCEALLAMGSACGDDIQCDGGLSCFANLCSDKSVGSACEDDSQCGGGLSCFANSCSDMSAGRACAANVQCGGGLYCDIYEVDDDGDEASGVCEAGQGAGSVCVGDIHCAVGFPCLANRCSDMSAGSACEGDDQCGGGLYCDTYEVDDDGDEASGVCEARQGAGGVCGGEIHCVVGLPCLANRCSDMSAGSACAADTHCAGGLYCDTYEADDDGDEASGVCEARLPVTNVCSGTNQCAAGLSCNVNLCSDRGIGRACESASQCASGLYCDTLGVADDGDSASNVCEERLSVNNSCVSFLQCANRFPCVAGQCSDGSAGSACEGSHHCGTGLYCDTLGIFEDGDPASNVCESF